MYRIYHSFTSSQSCCVNPAIQTDKADYTRIPYQTLRLFHMFSCLHAFYSLFAKCWHLSTGKRQGRTHCLHVSRKNILGRTNLRHSSIPFCFSSPHRFAQPCDEPNCRCRAMCARSQRITQPTDVPAKTTHLSFSYLVSSAHKGTVSSASHDSAKFSNCFLKIFCILSK